jgi:hypothetical protein
MAFYPATGSQGISPPLALSGGATAAMITTQETGDTQPRVVIETNGIWLGGGSTVPGGPTIQSGGSGVTQVNGKLQCENNVDVAAAGFGVAVAEGSNAKQGTGVLSSGTVVVSNTSVTANSRIFLTAQSVSGTAGALAVTARTAGTSFTVTSTSGTDASTFAYEIFEPG